MFPDGEAPDPVSSPELEWDQNHNFHTDYNLYQSLIPSFKSNLAQLAEHDVARKTVPRVKYDDLTLGQKAAFKIVETHFTSLKMTQLLMGIYGGPGTGKSIVVDSLLCLLGQTVRSMAFVGQAAFHVDGTTIHSLLKVPFHLNSPYDLSDARVEELHESLKDVRYFIIDEISMVSKRLFI